MARLDPKFILKNAKTKTDTEVWLRVYYHYETLTYPLVSLYTNKVLRIHPSLWDKKNAKPIKKGDVGKEYVKYKAAVGELSILIDMIESVFPDILDEARLQNILITNEYLKNALDIKLGKKAKPKRDRVSLADFLDQILGKMRSGLLLTDSQKKYTEGAIKPYNTLKNDILMFDVMREKTTFFNDIDKEWYDDLILFMYNEFECPELELEKEEYAPSSVGKYIGSLKRAMKVATSMGFSNNKEYLEDYFRVPKSDSFAVVLSMTELDALYNLKLETKEDREMRDLFLIACYSSLRFSDFNRIKPSYFNIEGETLILKMQTQKTKAAVQIPVVDKFKEIVERYEYKLPKVNSVVFNRKIKEIAAVAGLNNEMTYFVWKGGEAKEVTEPKCKLIASHTGRRTCITNLYFYYQLDYERIMKISGHKTIDQLKKYIRFGEVENALEVAKVMEMKHKEDGR